MLRDNAAVGISVKAPDIFVELFLAEYLHGVQRQKSQDPIFRLGKWDRLVSIVDSRFFIMNGKPVKYFHGTTGSSAALPPQMGFHPCAQLVDTERL